MARAFPNLRRLHFEATPSAAVPDIGHWRKLDFVSASHPLPLQHPVRHFFMRWHLDAYSYRRPEVDQALEHGTITMLQHILPVVLECSAHRRTFTCIARHAPSVRCMRTTVAVPVLSIYNRGHGHDWGRTIVHRSTSSRSSELYLSKGSPLYSRDTERGSRPLTGSSMLAQLQPVFLRWNTLGCAGRPMPIGLAIIGMVRSHTGGTRSLSAPSSRRWL
ncbi:uncharacterized protein B0H18DRAFT_1080038 [Fomitopsis serialis]|uniref:uncharacterized protein n=1 Tax=Fomitopsis serialis TaxID=139415 RepID=UPI002007841F|nr:uncharacterized protein B0H18DRAFT_1080038 [Neoantrodia serialis]KAH9905548.1 hypothetical protein B0H18DRAFT_1080038 [Neoantrodia serialis]